MNVYDFDKTLFRGDSTRRFLVYLIGKQPRLLAQVPGFLGNALLFGLKLRKKQAFKEKMFRGFFGHAKNIDQALSDFWQKNLSRIFSWYAQTQRPDDVVISASPEDLVRPACQALGIVHIMGSPVDLHTGRYLGPNCHGEEKVRRFREAFPGGQVDTFYSDSHSDDPMARIAKKAVLVRGEKLLPWN